MNNEELSFRIAALEQQVASLPFERPDPDEQAQLVKRLSDIVVEAEKSQRKADDEARRANDAKVACEEHAKFTAATRGKVEVELAAVNALVGKTEEAQRAAFAARNGVDEALTNVLAAKEVVQRAEASVMQFSAAVETSATSAAASKETAETNSADCSSAWSKIRTLSEEVARERDKVGTLLGEMVEYKNETSEHRTKSAVTLEGIEDAQKETTVRVKELEKMTVDLGEQWHTVDTYKKDLDSLKVSFKEMYDKVDGLLPHAASASLASAFREQKDRFKWPKLWWLMGFVVAVLLLLGIAVPDFAHEVFPLAGAVGETAFSWDSILRHMVRRLPLVLPLVWLAIYAGRNYTIAVRLEEDYAFKEAVSTAFEGYKREMASVEVSDGQTAPLHTLCDNVLNALAQRPGRIYEGEHHDVTPITPALAAATKLITMNKNSTDTEQ